MREMKHVFGSRERKRPCAIGLHAIFCENKWWRIYTVWISNFQLVAPAALPRSSTTLSQTA